MADFIFVGNNFCGLNKNDTFVGLKIRGHSIFFHNSYRKLPFRGYWNSWIGPSTKTTKIGTPRNLSHPQYLLTDGHTYRPWKKWFLYTATLLHESWFFSYMLTTHLKLILIPWQYMISIIHFVIEWISVETYLLLIIHGLLNICMYIITQKQQKLRSN